MLENTTLLITGAGRGLGAAIARSAYRHGARVIVNYWQSENQARALVGELGKRARAIRADVHSACEVLHDGTQPLPYKQGLCPSFGFFHLTSL